MQKAPHKHADQAQNSKYDVLENMALPVLLCDAGGEVFFANQAALAFLSKPLSYVVGRDLCADLLPDMTAEQIAVWQAALAQEKLQFHCDQGDEGTWQMTRNIEGEVYYLCLYQAREETQSQVTIDQMRHIVSVLAHEIKNPLAGMRGAAQILSSKVAPDMQHFTRLLMDEVDRIGALVESLSFFEEQPKGQEKWVNIHEVIHQAKEIVSLGAEKPIEVKEVYDPSLPDLYIDAHKLTQVITNLLKNAVEASGAEAKISIETAYKHDVYTDGKRTPLVISIYNHDCQIDQDMAAHLFTPFMTSKEKGKGLGLAISKQMIQRYGGDIILKNVGDDVLCQISLPLLKEPKDDG